MSLLNRFFFRCPRCLYAFAADAEGHKAPRVESCGCCGASYVKCLGATRGVLSWGVPCNDVCVFASGQDCSCSCGGKNHGSRLLVPVIKNVVDFSGRLPLLEKARREWSVWSHRIGEAKRVLSEGAEVPGDAVRILERFTEGVYESQSWDNRRKRLGELLARLNVKIAAFSPVSSAPLVAAPLASEDAGELFAWGGKWAGVSPQFRGHAFTVPAVPGVAAAFSFSPQ